MKTESKNNDFVKACKDKKVEEIIALYKEELDRKDEMILRLKEENLLLMKASLRASKERMELKEQLERKYD